MARLICFCDHSWDDHVFDQDGNSTCNQCNCTDWQLSPIASLNAARDEGAEEERDPTWIEIATDPTKSWMTGVARHGNTPFSVPYVSHIADSLWQGGCENGMILPKNIEHLVSLYPWEAYTVEHELKSNMYVKLYDSTDQGFELINGIAVWVAAAMDDGEVLVHCQAGLNRSSLVAARALMFRGLTADQAIDLIREVRSPACLCNPAFESWLRSL